MAPFALADPKTYPLHVLFPEDYQASRRMIARDFAFFGVVIVASVVLVAVIGAALP